jgi:hypothetical protein
MSTELDRIKTLPRRRIAFSRVDDVDKAEKSVTAIINTAAVDRYETIIRPKGLKVDNFRRNPVVLWCHCRHLPPIGTAAWIKYRRSKNDWLAKTVFARDDFSMQLFEQCAEDILRAWSISFDPDWDQCSPPTQEEIKADPALKECRYYFRQCDLLEYSLVTVPGNADCLTEEVQRSIPDDWRIALEQLGIESPATRPAPGRETPPPVAEVPALPPLVGRTFQDAQAEMALAIELARSDFAAQVRDRLDLIRGRI